MTAQQEGVCWGCRRWYDSRRHCPPEIGPGRPREIQMARETWSARSGAAGTADPGPRVRSAQKGVFRKEGEYWTVGYGGKAFRLKDTKGLGYLAHLLRHPAVEFHVLDLVGGIASQREEDETSPSAHGLPRGDEELEKAGIHIASLGDAGEMLDEQAKLAYRRRLSDLREELDEAKELGKVERATQTEQEIDALTRELSRAVGLGGRNRRAASASERARQSITKTIKAVLDRIAQSDATLGEIFSRCIKTGTFCSYQPDPDFPIAWEFAATEAGSTTIEPAEQPTSSGDPAPVRADHQRTPPVVLDVSPFSLAERTAFVGRENERGAIRAVIDRALNGHGSLVMLGGGPGVGKSRLAMEMAEYASRVGFRCLVGHCYEREEPFPYLPFVEIIESSLAQAASLDDYRRRLGDNAAELAQIAPSLRRFFPDIPQPLELPPAQKRRYLFQSFTEALGRAARTRSYVNILEDLHWAHESTLALLVHLANRIAQLPVVIIGTYRDGYSENNPALVRTLEELIRLGIRPLKLGGLSKDAIAQMLNELSQGQAPESLVSAIFEESQGNPFFVEEVYRHLIEDGKVFDAAGRFRTDIEIDESDVPENVRLIIGRRLARLDENGKQALAAAAVIGRGFSFQLLTGISLIDVDELFTVIEKAQQMGIIVPSSEGPEKPFTFAHELVRQTLLAGISAPHRQQLHASVADAIERLDPNAVSERAGEIADHLVKAGSFADDRKLFHYLTLAGKNALEAAAFEEARRSLLSALSLQGAVGITERAPLLASLAVAEQGLERWDAALAHLNESLEIYLGVGDREMIGRSFTELTDAFIWAGHFQEATETARRGLVNLSEDVSLHRARLLAALGQARAAAGEYESANEALREALNIASQLSDPKLMARLLGARSIVNFHFFRLKEAAADGFRSEQLGGSEAPPWQRALQLRVLHQTLLFLGRLEEALRIADELEPLAKKIGQTYSLSLCLKTRAWAEFAKEPDLAKLETGIQQESKSDQMAWFAYWEAVSEVQLSLIDFFRGNWAGALLHAQASCRPEPGSSVEGFGVGTLFRQMAYAGDHDGALALLDEKRTWLPLGGQPNARGSWMMLALVIEGLVMLGEQSQAAQFYPLARELIATGAVLIWPISRFTHTIAGIAAGAARQWEAAENHFQIALKEAESLPSCLEQAEIRRFHAMMLMDHAAPGNREKARTLLSEALASYARIGVPRHIEMTQALLDQGAGG
jgi:tetratricopeptide (TPR) repeat protein